MNIQEFIQLALDEDTAGSDFAGDHTSQACIPGQIQSRARLLVKDKGVIAGVDLARQIFEQIDAGLSFETHVEDGATVEEGDVAFHVAGEVKSILLGERLVLNLMQRMSGISTMTRRFVDAIDGTQAKILDTRKTTPNLRYFEKWAVRIGGGHNHRFGLYDMIMIKDNHIDYCGGLKKAILAVQSYLKQKGKTLPVEIETRSLEDVRKVLEIGHVDRIMMDNFRPDQVKEAVAMVDSKYETEASGGITLDNVRYYADTGVDFISSGALTHSAGSMDMSLKAVAEEAVEQTSR